MQMLRIALHVGEIGIPLSNMAPSRRGATRPSLPGMVLRHLLDSDRYLLDIRRKQFSSPNDIETDVVPVQKFPERVDRL